MIFSIPAQNHSSPYLETWSTPNTYPPAQTHWPRTRNMIKIGIIPICSDTPLLYHFIEFAWKIIGNLHIIQSVPRNMINSGLVPTCSDALTMLPRNMNKMGLKPTCSDTLTALPRNMLMNTELSPCCLETLSMPDSYPPAQMRSLRFLEIWWSIPDSYPAQSVCLSRWVQDGVDMFLGMAENASEQVGLSRINQSFIQSCGSALVR